MTRRTILNTAAAATALAASRPTKDDISLAAWSINRSFFGAHRWKNLDLPRLAREQFNITGLEFVNQFFENPMMSYLNQLKKNGDSYGVRFVLIMIDGEGDMSAVDKKERAQAAIAHRKWVDIAHYLGCHSIRCNMGGPRQNWKQDTDLVSRAAESFHNLLGYAQQSDLNIIVENHGGASSDPDVVVKLVKAVDNPNFGTLPDFGNFNPGDDNAKGISVKAAWAADGTHPGWDLEKIIRICQESGYHGFWGIESSFARTAQNQSADQIWENELKGVQLTKAVLERAVLKKERS